VSGDHDLPAVGHEKGTVAITESDRIFGTLRCGSAAERLGAIGTGVLSEGHLHTEHAVHESVPYVTVDPTAPV
jgi:hypothetical protein